MQVTRRGFLMLGGAVAGAGVLGVPPVVASSEEMSEAAEGIHWPRTRALPSFARPRHLDVGDVRGLTDDERTLLPLIAGAIDARQSS
jgi:hypothetical protein